MAESLITQHIDLWTSSIEAKSTAGRGSKNKFDLYGIKKLRELILELAVRGKLVPQDPNDESASVLLREITNKNALLRKDDKSNKNYQSPVTHGEQPFELPERWEWVRVKDIYQFEYGNSLPEQTRSNSGEYNVYGSNGIVGTHYQRNVEKPCIVIGRKGSAGALNLSKNDHGCWVTDVAYSTVPPEQIDLKFAFIQFHTFGLSSLGKGIKPGLNRNDAYELVIGIPPVAEQHRIVAKVDELMALCDQLEQQTLTSIDAHATLVETLLETLTNSADAAELEQNWARISEHFDTLFTTEQSIDALKQTILQLAVMGKLVRQDPTDEPASVLLEKIAAEKAQLIKDKKIKKEKPLPPISDDEKPFELPQGWEWVNLHQVITEMDAGWSPACPPESSPNDETWGVLKTTAVQTLEYLENENKVLSSNLSPKPQYEVKMGDILITRAGPKNRVGISCLVEQTRPRLMISDKIIRFHLVNGMGLSERFISLCLNAGATSAYLELSKSGMAESQMNISQDKLKMAPLPLPPVQEQERIISKLDELIMLCDSLKSPINQLLKTQLYLTDAIIDEALR